MLYSPKILIDNQEFQNPILYGEYVQGILYIQHPDKKIALNIPANQVSKFITTLFTNTQSKFQQELILIYLKSADIIHQENDLKTKKHRQNLLPDAIFMIPTLIKTSTPKPQEINILDVNKDQIIHFPPINNRLHIDYPKEDKTSFLNRLSNIQKKLSTSSHINFQFTLHSKHPNSYLWTKLIDSKFPSIFFENSDFSIISQTHPQTQPQTQPTANQPQHTQPEPNLKSIHTNHPTNKDLEHILLSEKYPRNFQNGQIQLYQQNQIKSFEIINPTYIIQENLICNSLQKISPTSKPFQIYQKLHKYIRQINESLSS